MNRIEKYFIVSGIFWLTFSFGEITLFSLYDVPQYLSQALFLCLLFLHIILLACILFLKVKGMSLYNYSRTLKDYNEDWDFNIRMMYSFYVNLSEVKKEYHLILKTYQKIATSQMNFIVINFWAKIIIENMLD